LKKLKITQQEDFKNPLKYNQNSNKKNETLSTLLNPKPTLPDNNANLRISLNMTQKLVDGYWILLQDWSQCDRACGGGKSTLHRMCVPPKNGGKACEGEPIQTKVCNQQPCPDLMGNQANNGANNGAYNGANNGANNNNTQVSLKPVVKVLPFSNRPQRYTKCVIKESDLMLFQNHEKLINPLKTVSAVDMIQIPTRTVMNNRSVTIFGGEDYSTMIDTFTLKETSFSRSKRAGCFILKQGVKTSELCPLSGIEAKIVEEWDYDFNLFKNQCTNHQDILAINEKELENKFKDEMVKNC
jgi:hypothetical protein